MLCCCACATEIARREHVFAMSSDGLHANYTNLGAYRSRTAGGAARARLTPRLVTGGYMHDIVTVSRTTSTELTGAPSAEYSWFPGYTWTIAVCASCMAHVGWRWVAGGGAAA